MNELLKLLARDKGIKGYRGTVLLGVAYIAVQVTSLKEEVGALHTRVAVIEARLNFPGAVVTPQADKWDWRKVNRVSIKQTNATPAL